MSSAGIKKRQKMRQVEELKVQYVGYSQPTTEGELLFEIAGLELAVCEIQSRIAKLRQANQLRKLIEAANETNQ
jgi:hypothetical protein